MKELPLSSYNLNKMQSDILEDGIIVSPTEPTEDRRKVWFQKGTDTNTVYVKNDNDEYEEFIKKEEERIDITNEMEYATNEYIDGNRVYRKRMLLGYGPNNSSPKAYPIGVQGFNIIKANLCLKQNALYIPLPLISADTAAIVNYYIDGTNLIIQAGRDRSSFLVRAEIYYIK